MSVDPLKNPVRFAVLAAVITLLLKTSAYFVTGSVGLLSDAAESGVNLLASLTAMASLWYSAKPVDESHTYGHEKIEYFSSGLEGLLIIIAAIGIGWYAVERLIHPVVLNRLEAGAIVALVASGINLIAARWLLSVGRTHRSIVLEADGQHLMTDVWTSVALVAGLTLAWLTGIDQLDPILALCMAANISWTGFGLIRRSFNGLMDHSLPHDEQAAVRAAIDRQLTPGTAYHALRTRQAGARRFVDFHLLVPGQTTVATAHWHADEIEKTIAAALPGVEVTIHIEPIEDQASWQDSELLKVERQNEHNP